MSTRFEALVDSLRSMDELANKLTVMVLLLMEFV